MTSKTKTTFNLNKKQVYKYNIVKIPTKKIDHLNILNSIQLNTTILNDRIDEYYYVEVKLDRKRTIHRFQFTIKEEEEVKVDE